MWKTEYSGDNDTRSDSLWSSIRPARGVVALDHEWAVDHSLPRAQDFLGDPSKGLYIIDAYHQLHCLVSSFTKTNHVQDLEVVQKLRTIDCDPKLAQRIPSWYTTVPIFRTSNSLLGFLATSRHLPCRRHSILYYRRLHLGRWTNA